MNELRPPRYFWFKLAIVVGCLLGVLLLYQSISSYYYVSRWLVSEQLRREADRYAAFVERSVREQQLRDPAQVAALLENLRREYSTRIVWMRLLDSRAEVQVEAGRPVGRAFTEKDIQRVSARQNVVELRDTPEGPVLVTLIPVRLFLRPLNGAGPGLNSGRPPGLPATAAAAPAPPGAPLPADPPRPPDPARRGGPRSLEVALYRANADQGALWPLRRNLIIDSSAALALLGSMVILVLQFGPYVRGKQLEQQLEVARQVQRDLLPASTPSIENLDCAAECVPAWQVGGDFYDVFTSTGKEVALVLGDVSGKGLPAALVMGLIHGAVRSLGWSGGAAEIESASVRLNQLLYNNTSRERFASLFWGYFDRDAGMFHYVNAGHLPPLVVHRNGSGEAEILKLEEGGPVLGAVPSVRYRHGAAPFSAGDLLVLFSDGVVEAENAREEDFGSERLSAIVSRSWNRPAKEVLDEILGQVKSFLGEEQPNDDLTLLVVRAQ